MKIIKLLKLWKVHGDTRWVQTILVNFRKMWLIIFLAVESQHWMPQRSWDWMSKLLYLGSVIPNPLVVKNQLPLKMQA